VSAQGVEYAAANGYSLIVTLDCGIKAADKVLMAKALDIDFIICDHHRPDDILPEAVAVLDPKRSDCAYPYKELTGCGVGFKLLQAMCVAKGYDDDMLMDSLDFLVVSIAADIVPITGENRVLAYYGLKKLNEQKRISFKALAEVAGLNNELNITNVVFGFAPRINAAGRIAHAKAATDLLLSNDWEEALDFAKKINAHNAERRNVDTGITDEALNMIRDNELSDSLKSTVLYKADWHKGVVGIVASRCIEHFYRPTIILTNSNGKATGSARSVAGFDVYEAIEACSDLLEQFGGHTFAAGLTLPVENIEPFRQKFESIVNQRITAEQLVPQIDIDLELDLQNINPKFYNIIKQMAPFGPQNMTPVFVSHGLKVVGNPVIMKEKHIKFDVYQEGSPKFTAVAFGMAEYKTQLVSGQPFSMAYNIEENNFRDKTTLQLFVKDLKFEE
jgi:single-stranded-DNA-specific exonuclease